MNGNLFLRTSVVLLIIGVGMGLYMGASQDHTQSPAHAHLNLVGGVWMFLAGLFYKAHPQLSSKLTFTHYVLTMAGLAFFIPGIYAAQTQAPWMHPTIEIGSMLTAVQVLFFAYLVFKATDKKAA